MYKRLYSYLGDALANLCSNQSCSHFPNLSLIKVKPWQNFIVKNPGKIKLLMMQGTRTDASKNNNISSIASNVSSNIETEKHRVKFQLKRKLLKRNIFDEISAKSCASVTEVSPCQLQQDVPRNTADNAKTPVLLNTSIIFKKGLLRNQTGINKQCTETSNNQTNSSSLLDSLTKFSLITNFLCPSVLYII